MREVLNQGLIDFLKASPTPFHATASLAQRLEAWVSSTWTSARAGPSKPAGAIT